MSDAQTTLGIDSASVMEAVVALQHQGPTAAGESGHRGVPVHLTSGGKVLDGTLRFLDVDVDDRTLALEVFGRERGGAGIVKGTLRARVIPARSRSQLTGTVSLSLAGLAPQLSENLATSLLTTLADHIERAAGPSKTRWRRGAGLAAVAAAAVGLAAWWIRAKWPLRRLEGSEP